MRPLAAAALLALLAPAARAAHAAADALAARDSGRLEDARADWVQAAASPDADGFVWAQRGWAELAVGRGRDARASFARAVDRAGSAPVRAEAQLGEGLAFLLAGKPRDALEPLRLAGLAGPYEIAASSRLRAEAALAAGDPVSALAYLRRALELDSYDRDSLRLLLHVLVRDGAHDDAWRAAERLLRMDPADAEARRAFQRERRLLKGDPDAVLGLRRMTRPQLDPDDVDASPLVVSTRTIRVGLYGTPAGIPAVLTGCVLVPNADYRVTASSGDASRASGSAGEPRLIEFDPDTRRVDVRDLAGDLLFEARGPLRVEPSSPRGSVLVSSAAVVAADAARVDRGDREPRGTIVVLPSDSGFRLVAEAPLERYLYGVVSLSMPDGAPDAALEAEAVVARTAAVRAAASAPPGSAWDVVDSGQLRTIGVSGELRAATAAVAATDGVVLTRDGSPIDAPQDDDSGGWTESGAADGTFSGPRPVSGLALERFLHDPPTGLFSAASAAGTPASSRWTLVLDARGLRQRAAQVSDVGKILSVLVSSRSATGRVEALDVVGKKGTLELKGSAAIQAFLSPGSLRSTLFSLQPLNSGTKLERLIVWGAGTGDGRGFALAGALGQAVEGADWRAILHRYFPDATLSPEPRKK